MSKTIEYKGFTGTYQYLPKEEIYHGTIDNIKDLVTFETPQYRNINNVFIDAVDDYLKLKEELSNNEQKISYHNG